MASYPELIRQDVHRHEPCEDTSSWPSSVSQFVQLLQNELKLPRWLKSGLVPYTNERVLNLLDQLRASVDASGVDLWDATDKIIDRDVEERLHIVFNTALVDCARIQAVIETESATQTPYPKESFIAILLRDAIMNAHAGLSSLEDVLVVFPRHFSGEAIPTLSYMTKSFYVSLIISICENMPMEESGSDLRHQSNNNGDSRRECVIFRHPPPTMSEFLDACERPETLEEPEDEQEEPGLSPRFEAYFIAHPPSVMPPSICHVPVLCMADEAQLPVLMSSLLYQRRVWHIGDPLIGVEFSKYNTTIRLFLGWLEDDISDRVLPRVHLGEIRTPVRLDLSSPSATLVVSRLLCSLDSHISGVRDTMRRSVGAVISDTESRSTLAWRIDTDLQEDESVSILENNNNRDRIIRWVESQYSICEETMPPRKPADKISSPSSTTLAPSPQLSSTQSSNPTSPPPDRSNKKSQSIPEISEPPGSANNIPTLLERLSCSKFAATSKETDYRIFRWMFDRWVVPQSVPSDLEFREHYSNMTGFIWPEGWNARKDLPPVDAGLEPCVQELLESVASLKTRSGAIQCLSKERFPIDLQILERSFSAIFQASLRSREKTKNPRSTKEIGWRHDHDRLLQDFFIRLVQPGDARTMIVEDPLARPTLEAVLHMPKSDALRTRSRQQFLESSEDLWFRRAPDFRSWVKKRDGSLDISLTETENAAYILAQRSTWRDETGEETEAEMISKLGEHPVTGTCDAFGRLLVELPYNDVSLVPLVKYSAAEEKNEGQASTDKSRAGTYYKGKSKQSTKASSTHLSVPEDTPESKIVTDGKRYTIFETSFPSSMPSPDKDQTSPAKSMRTLTSRVQGLRIGANATHLELPILTVEYKKMSDTQMKGTNQVRMYLTASVKFLEALDITNIAVYGVQAEGPRLAIPAAVIRDDKLVYLFERLVEELDISTPLGAFHYATILCRLAQNHAKILEERFKGVKDKLDRQGTKLEGWTMVEQLAKLESEGLAKLPPKKSKNTE